MRFSFLSIVAVLFATVSAQTKPNAFTLPSDFMITAGQPTTVTWTPSTPGTVTIRLRQGASSDLDQGVVVGSHIDNNGKYTFTIPASTVRNTGYALEIISDSDSNAVNYSPSFVVESKNTVASQTAATSAVASAATSATASSTRTRSRSTMSTMNGSTAAAQTTDSSSPTMASGSAGVTTGTVESTSAPTSGAIPRKGDLRVQGGLVAMALGIVMVW
ncbi:MAG: hypothetical protein Q9190_001560 [Brigantiaea leucoxantha]